MKIISQFFIKISPSDYLEKRPRVEWLGVVLIFSLSVKLAPGEAKKFFPISVPVGWELKLDFSYLRRISSTVIY